KELASRGEIALRRDRSGQVIDRPQGLEIGFAEETAPPAHYLLLDPLGLRQIALCGERNGQFPDRLQCVRMPLAQLAATPFDDPLLELARRDQPPLRPQAIGKVEHRRKRLRMVFTERVPPLCQQSLPRLAAVPQRL